jgi:hypothetical protein
MDEYVSMCMVESQAPGRCIFNEYTDDVHPWSQSASCIFSLIGAMSHSLCAAARREHSK